MTSGAVIAPRVQVGPFKIITDGSLNTRTAHCVEPYLSVEGEQYGAMNFPSADIEAILFKAQQAGFWLAVHAIGDEANRIVLDIFEKHQLRGRIEHAQLVREEDFARFAALGVVASVQPEHAIDDRDVTDVYWADRTRDGREPWHPGGGLTYDEALRFSTRTTLEVGQPAHIVALEADPRWLLEALTGDPARASDALREMSVALTVSGGNVTHDAVNRRG